MLLDEVRVPAKFLQVIKEQDQVSKLYPPQEHAIKSGLLEGKNLVLATPTASGKTLLAELAIVKVLSQGKKSVYVVPLRSLAYEKFQEFRQKYSQLGYQVRLEMGDLDSSHSHLGNFDVLIVTAEKLDSLLRSRKKDFQQIGLLVMDEVHLIATDRGPVYEIIIAKFQKLFPGIQTLALSATIGNAGEIAAWLKAGLVETDWRPVELVEETRVGKKFTTLKNVITTSISHDGQVLVFVNSRRSAEAVAEKLGAEMNLAGGKRAALEEISQEILAALASPTRQCQRLARCVKTGTAFHHAGEVNKQRIAVEDSFKKGIVKVVVATPTLAFGVNLPSRVVVIRDLKRYGRCGYYDYIPVLEYKQMAGRAGRPKYDSTGQAIILAANQEEAALLEEKYINGQIEKINSRLGVESVLRFHVLAVIASQFSRTEESLLDFLRLTFFSHQYGLSGFEEKIEVILNQLIAWDFIKKEGRFLFPTPLGARISELYLDPQTAYNYINFLTSAERKEKVATLGLLEVLCDAVEMPLLRVNREKESLLWEQAAKFEDEFLREIDAFDLDYTFLERFRTATLFNSWTNEISEELILEKYKVAPGILNQKVRIMEWLSYAAAEMAKVLNLKKIEEQLRKLKLRMKYGIKDELIPLVRITGIGRARARKLFQAGIKKPSDVKKAPLEKLSRLIGKKVAEKVKQRLA